MEIKAIAIYRRCGTLRITAVRGTPDAELRV